MRHCRRELQVLRDLSDERDRLYTERDASRGIAVTAALAAAQALNNAAAAASEKAVDREQANAEKWRENANEWRAAMQDREIKFASRDEMAAKFNALEVAVISLKETRAETTGGRSQKDDVRANLALLAAVVSSLISIAVLAMNYGAK